MTDQQRKRLQTAIARLKREITVLLAKPLPHHTDPRKAKHAETRRRNAISQRRNQIADYQQRINQR